MAHEQYIQYSDSDLARLLGLDEPIERLEMIRRLNADDVEDFAVALSAAIDSQIDVPGAHAVTDMYRAALARAERAEAEVERLQAMLAGAGDDGATRWRPITEAPPDNRFRPVVDREYGTPEMAWYNAFYNEWMAGRHDIPRWLGFTPTHWLEIYPLPTEATP